MAQDAPQPKAAAADGKAKPEEEEPAVVAEVSAEALALADIATNVGLVKKSVATAESRFCWRVLRSLPWLRKKLDATVLQHAINKHFPRGAFP